MPEPRDPVTLRLRPTTVEALDALAHETNTNRSQAARALIGAALSSPTALSAARTILRSDRM